MTSFIERDQIRRKLYRQYELKRLEYKSFINDLSIPKDIRFKYIQRLNKLPRNSSITRIRNRCILSGRGRSVFRYCKLSRIVMRQLAAQGLINGVKKSNW